MGRLVRGEALGTGGQTRVQDQTTSLEQVEESRGVAKDLQLDQEREVLKNQEPPQENQEAEAVGSKVEATESKEEVEVKQVPARERNCRLASTSARVSMRGSLARAWQDVRSVALNDQ